MKLPYVIDNETTVLLDLLSEILEQHGERSLDVATAYFTVGGYGLLRRGLGGLGSFRLLLGAEPYAGEQVGLRPDPEVVRGLLTRDLERLPFDEETLRIVEDLIGWLRTEKVRVRLHQNGFLHAKAWLFYSDRPGQQMLFDRFRPILAIVGSSNFTIPGLTSNRELNLAHKVLLDETDAEDPAAEQAVEWLSDARPSEKISLENRQLLKSEVGARAIIDLEKWYQRQWEDARDFKDDLIALLDASKFGQKEYTPYQVYMKALYEYFKDDLGDEAATSMRSAVDLAEFQEDAVKKARKILHRYDGVLIADSVGLGKTWIGKKLLEDFAYHMRQKALVVCPAALRDMWQTELQSATIAAQIVSQEEMGREEFDWRRWTDADVIVIDESHNFRNHASNRYETLSSIVSANGGRGNSGARKKIILLTATPVNNTVFDLYNQLQLITQGDRSYFSGAGIGDVYKLFLAARRDPQALPLYNLLEEVVVRRTRPFIRKAYPEATIRGKKIRFPERKLKTIRYDLERTYEGLYEEIVSGIDELKLAPYHLEAFKKSKEDVDEMEEGREAGLVGIFKSRYLKRFESSVEAFRISIRRALKFQETFEDAILDGRVLRSREFHKALRYVARDEEDDESTVGSIYEEMEESEVAESIFEEMEEVDASLYDLQKIHRAVRHDIDILGEIYDRVKEITPDEDLKLLRLKELLRNDLRGEKLIIFTYYKDTAKYLYRHIGDPKTEEGAAFREELGGVEIRRLDSDTKGKDRTRVVQFFAPRANEREELVGSEDEIDILISTDVLAEGQNLQDCGSLLNYDLHWNPTRMVQRAGRIDRIGSDFETLWINNMFPDEGLERLLKIVESLSRKIESIDQLGMLDASVLGEEVHPRNFNTLRRIRDEDGAVIEEQERFTELVSHEYLEQQLREFLQTDGESAVSDLPDGIHSGLRRDGSRGVFFYFQAREGQSLQHFWRYVDLKENTIIDNRFLIANLIACPADTPRVVEPEMFEMIFNLQERAIENILESVEQQAAMQSVPRAIDPIQQTLATILQQHLSHPEVNRGEALELIRFLNQPMMKAQTKKLRKVHSEFESSDGIGILLQELATLRDEYGAAAPDRTVEAHKAPRLEREDLRLICFDLVTG